MAGLRNTEAAAIDATIATLLSQYATYAAVSVTGEAPNAPADYFMRILVANLGTNADLTNIANQIGGALTHFKPVGLAEAALPTLVLVDPKAVA